MKYDIHPEYELHLSEKSNNPAWHEWHVTHTPTGESVGFFRVNNTHKERPSISSSEVKSPYHKNIGELAYKKLVRHYGSLRSDETHNMSSKAHRVWQNIGARIVNGRYMHKYDPKQDSDFSSALRRYFEVNCG
jgi:hypothetical protein